MADGLAGALALLLCAALAACGMSETQMKIAIVDAATKNDARKVKALLKKKPELLHCRLGGGDGLLYYAASHPDALRVLLDAGLDPNGDSPLLHTKSAEAATLLLDRGADVKGKASAGFTPLHAAADGGLTDVARVLLERGAEVDAKNQHGATPLHLAALGDHLEVAALLLAKGADPAARLNPGVAMQQIKWKGARQTSEFDSAGEGTPLAVARSQRMRDLLTGKR